LHAGEGQAYVTPDARHDQVLATRVFDRGYELRDVAGLVAKTLGNSQRVLVVSPAFLDHDGRPESPADLSKFDTVASTDDMFDDGARWILTNPDNRTKHY